MLYHLVLCIVSCTTDDVLSSVWCSVLFLAQWVVFCVLCSIKLVNIQKEQECSKTYFTQKKKKKGKQTQELVRETYSVNVVIVSLAQGG